jgi:hypothetical protein
MIYIKTKIKDNFIGKERLRTTHKETKKKYKEKNMIYYSTPDKLRKINLILLMLIISLE